MTIALRFCVKKNGSTVPSIQTDAGNTTVTGDTLFVAVTDPNATVSVSDTINGAASGNTWTRVGTALTTGVVVSNVWRCENANGGTNHRVTVTASSGTMDAAVYFGAISGAAAASFDQTAQGNATSSPYTGVSTPALSQANELAVVLAGTDGSASAFAESTGFTIQAQENNSSLYWCSALATKITSATTALTPSFTVTGGSGAHLGIIIATFKEAAGGTALAASASDVASASAALTTQIKLGAAAADSAASSAAVTTAIRLAMSAVTNAAASGALSTGIRLAADASVASSAGAAIATGAVLAATAVDVAASVAALTTIVQISAAATDTASANAALTNWATVTLSGALYTGQGGALYPNSWVDAVPGIGTTLYYDASHITIYPNGEISSDSNDCAAVVQFFDGSSWAMGLIVLTPQLAAVAKDSSSAAAQLSTAIQLAASAQALATVVAAFSTGAGLTASGADVASASGALLTQIPLSALAQDVAAAAGALSAQIKLAAAAANTVTADATLNGVIVLQAAASAVASSLAGLTTGIPVAGTAQNTTAAVGSLSTGIRLSGAAQDAATAVASLNTAVLLNAAATNAVTAGGDLQTARLLVASALDAVDATAILGTGISLQAAANDVVAASAALNTATEAMADALSQATATAILTDVIETPPIGAYVSDPSLIVSRSDGLIGTRVTPRFRNVDPESTDVLTFDFADQLAPGETLVGRVTQQIACIAGMDASATTLLWGVPSYDASMSKIMQPRRGGLDGCTYLIKLSAQTTNPQKRVALTALLPVRG